MVRGVTLVTLVVLLLLFLSLIGGSEGGLNITQWRVASVIGQMGYNTKASGKNSSQLDSPGAIALSQQYIWISDRSNKRVLGFDKSYAISNAEKNMLPLIPQFIITGATKSDLAVRIYDDTLWLTDDATEDFLQYVTISNLPVPVINLGVTNTFSFGFNDVQYVTTISTRKAAQEVKYRGIYWSRNNSTVYLSSDEPNQNYVQNFTLVPNPMILHTFGAGKATATNNSFDFIIGTGPFSVVEDCRYGIYIADTGNNRIVHYKQNAGTIDAHFGQVQVTGDGSGHTQTSLHSPQAIEMPDNCTLLWAADTANNRIIQYDISSYDPDERADAVLGQSNFTNSGSGTRSTAFNSPIDLAFDNTQGILWIVDQANNRVIGGYITPSPSPSPTPSLSATTSTGQNISPSKSPRVSPTTTASMTAAPSSSKKTCATAKCVTVPDLIINGTNSYTFNGTLLYVTGDVSLSNGTIFQFLPGQSALVGGCASFNGHLELLVTNLTDGNNQTLAIFNYTCVTSAFGSLSVMNGEEGSRCQIDDPQQSYTGDSLLVLFSVSGCDKPTTSSDSNDSTTVRKVIIGVTVGVGGCLVIILVVLFTFGIVFWCLRGKAKSYFTYDDSTLNSIERSVN